jgi:signal peptidase I
MPGDFVQVYEGVTDGGAGDGGWMGSGRIRMVKVPRGHCWLAGDNQGFSRDSRHYGPVPLGLVTGKVVWRVWPWDRWGRMENTLEEINEGELTAW